MGDIMEFADKFGKDDNGAEDTRDRVDLEGMELGSDGNIEDELGLMDSGDGDDAIAIRGDASSEMASRYAIDGVPDWFHYEVAVPAKVADNHTSIETNDWYLRDFKPIPLFSASIRAPAERYKDYEVVSGYRKADHSYTEPVELHRPHHAKNEGMKGLAMYPHSVIYHSAGMSEIVNVSLTAGCPASCSFCKESLLARGYTQADFAETAGMIRVTHDGRDFDVPSKIRVKFWDPETQNMLAGPISIPIMHGYPIDTESLRKIADRESFRVLYD